MKDGILILNKPQNWTSHDCVAVARKALGVEKIGHGGTLDPMARGLLPLFIGSATRIMEYLDLDDKTYVCKVRLGITTDTQDVWGQLLEERSPEGITRGDFERALGTFLGHQKQVPPKYSAVRVAGKRLYEYARDGEDIAVKARDIQVKDIRVLGFDDDKKEGSFRITVSKGTYIRTICHDLGEKLGCGGAMSDLERTQVGIFTLDGALSPERLKELMHQSRAEGRDFRIPKDITNAVIPSDVPLINLGRAILSIDRAYYFVAGNSIRWRQVHVAERPRGSAENKNKRGRGYDVLYRVYTEDGRFLGTGYYDEKTRELKADKIFMKRQAL